MKDENKKYSEGHFVGLWMGISIAIFSGIGIPLSVVTKNYAFLGIGPALGVAIGLSIGTGIESKYKKEGKIRPLTKEEKKRKKLGVTIGIVILTALSLIALMMFLLRS